jgi:hypothetical protein
MYLLAVAYLSIVLDHHDHAHQVGDVRAGKQVRGYFYT